MPQGLFNKKKLKIITLFEIIYFMDKKISKIKTLQIIQRFSQKLNCNAIWVFYSQIGTNIIKYYTLKLEYFDRTKHGRKKFITERHF